MADSTQGILYIVSTPIGNLADITYRSIETLQSVDLIAAEDTRHTKKLLNHYQITTALTSFHSHNQRRKSVELVRRLTEGQSVALVSDAGTPGISDPLYALVCLAVEEGITVCPIPGASAAVAALTVSGLPVDRFAFEGFLPRKKGRQKRLQELAHDPRTLIFYESPYRIEKTLLDLYAVFGDRPIALARELTKRYEEIIRGRLSDWVDPPARTWKGEITLIVGGNPSKFPGRPEEGD